MADLLYRWPDAARFGRRVPKEKLYEHGRVSPALRERFVADVQRITWAYKLAEATINLPGGAAVPEIQVFELDAKGADVPNRVLAAIDKAISFPIIFEITRSHGDERQVRMAAAQKQLGTGAPKLSGYYTTEWQPADAQRRPLPTAISIPALYSELLAPLLPLEVHSGEDLSEVADRLQTVRTLEREVAKLERKLSSEPQFNRKVELRKSLRDKRSDLARLTEQKQAGRDLATPLTDGEVAWLDADGG